MNESTFTFKNRRRLFLLTWILLFVNSQSMPIQCPELCYCYLNNNGLQSARCTELLIPQTSFPNIHVLTIIPTDSHSKCNIPHGIDSIFPQLNFLSLINCSLTEIPDYVFQDLTSLQEIDLSNNHIKNIDPFIFIRNERLRYANLQNNPFHITNNPFIISKSLWEIDLTSCGIHKLPTNMFQNLTQLKYLTLENNEIKTIDENVLPIGLKMINLAKNHIRDVPISELVRLKRIKSINLSQNPVNCTCALMGFENWVSGNGVRFVDGIECAYPREHAGKNLLKVSQYELCDAQVESQSLTTEICNDEICSNKIGVLDEGYIADGKKKNYPMDDFVRDEVVPVDKNNTLFEEQNDDSDTLEGSGNWGTDTPPNDDDLTRKNNTESGLQTSSQTTSKESSSEQSHTEVVAAVTEAITDNKVTMYNNEISTNATSDHAEKKQTIIEPNEQTVQPPTPQEPSTQPPKPEESPTPPPKPDELPTQSSIPKETSTPPPKSEESPTPPPKPEESPTPPPKPDELPTQSPKPVESPTSPPIPEETSLPTINSEKSTTPSPKSEEPPTDHSNSSSVFSDSVPSVSGTKSESVQAQERAGLISHNPDSSVFNLGYIIPCLAILIIIIICLGVYLGQRSSQKKNWEPNDTNNDGTEMQDASLLSDKSKSPIVKHTNKYPAEGVTEQTERLMTDGEFPTTTEFTENGNAKHSNGDKPPNGQTDSNEPIECAIAKVTTLPDSIPKTPIVIQNIH